MLACATNLMEPKNQRPQKNSTVRRNIMRNRNNTQNWVPQDVPLWETTRNPQHTENTWWSTNQPDMTTYLQLPPRKFQEQRRQLVNYNEEEDLSWCNKCGKPGHIQAFFMAIVYCHYCRMRSHNSKACWKQQRHENHTKNNPSPRQKISMLQRLTFTKQQESP